MIMLCIDTEQAKDSYLGFQLLLLVILLLIEILDY